MMPEHEPIYPTVSKELAEKRRTSAPPRRIPRWLSIRSLAPRRKGRDHEPIVDAAKADAVPE